MTYCNANEIQAETETAGLWMVAKTQKTKKFETRKKKHQQQYNERRVLATDTPNSLWLDSKVVHYYSMHIIYCGFKFSCSFFMGPHNIIELTISHSS